MVKKKEKNGASILDRNAKINKDLVAKQKQLDEKLAKIGINMKPEFKLSPPFSSNIMHSYNG